MLKKIYIFLVLLGLISCSEKKQNTYNEKYEGDVKSIHRQEKELHNKAVSFQIKIDSIVAIADLLNKKCISPKFNYDGNKLIFTVSNYSELWVYDIKSTETKIITNDNACGQYFFPLNFKDAVLFRTKSFKNGKRFYEIKQYDLKNQEVKTVYFSQNRLSNLTINSKEIFFIENSEPVVIDISKDDVKKNSHKPFYFINEGKLFRFKKKIQEVKFPKDKYEFVNCNISFDGEVVSALTKNNGIILLDIDGLPLNIYPTAVSISKLSKSNLVIIYSQYDDGSEITTTNISVGFTNSTNRIKISNLNDELIFDPAWSPTDNIISYTNDKGKIKLIHFSIK